MVEVGSNKLWFQCATGRSPRDECVSEGLPRKLDPGAGIAVPATCPRTEIDALEVQLHRSALR